MVDTRDQSREELFLKKKFQEYYLKNRIKQPKKIEKREFGVGFFGKKISLRHISFVSENNLNDFLQKNTPLFISYSIAYYELPERKPMEAKRFQGADLIYEFDADDLETKCKESHDSWKCLKCGKEGRGHKLACPYCSMPTLIDEWYCDECLEKAKHETMRLIDFLLNDFGFNENSLRINFSGNAGYHIHVQDNKIRSLSKEARIQLIDYLTLNSFSFEVNGFLDFKDNFLVIPLADKTKGISKRLYLQLKDTINSLNADALAAITNISVKKAKEFEKSKALDAINKGFLLNVFSQKQKNIGFWLSLLSYAASKVKLEIDRQTSIDVHKLIRLPDSLHGSTALKAKTILLEELNEFRPFTDAIVFDESPVKVFIDNAPRFTLMNESFGPFNKSEAELPLFAAAYLIGRQKAKLV